MTVLWVGLATGAIYALVALGFNLTTTVSGVLNFAHPHIIMICSFVAAWALTEEFPVAAIFVGCAVLGAVIGAAEERVAVRPLRGFGGHTELVTTVGAATVMTGVAVLIWGPDPRKVPLITSHGQVTLPGGSLSVAEILLILLAVALAIALHLWTRRSVRGLASLARAEDREAAMLRGVNVRAFSLAGFVAAGALAGVLAPIIGEKTLASAFIPLLIAIKGFTALTLGGIGHNIGVLIGGFAVGLIEAGAQYWVGGIWGNIAVFLVFVSVLLARPQGLLGEKELRAV